MSISRPDPASPAQVADATFSTGRRGYDQEEVRDFLRMVSAELGRLREREIFLERELRAAQANPDLDAAHLDDEALTRLVGEETARVLNAARASANEIRQKAEQSAARILTEASDEAARRREEAEVEASRRRTDAANDAEAEIAMAKEQGREMVNEARAYRERVLNELSRRRELARAQIEQLIEGRDRLMRAFENARLVAVDVVAELQPLGEPDEYVNLTPTTGPVPVMQVRQAPTDTVDAVRPDTQVFDGDDVDQREAAEAVASAEIEQADADAAADAGDDDAHVGDVGEAAEDPSDDAVDDVGDVGETGPVKDAAAEHVEQLEQAGDDAEVDDVEIDDAEVGAVEESSKGEQGADGEQMGQVADVEDGLAMEHADVEIADPDDDEHPATAEDDGTADDGDDVVVDLFARIRNQAASDQAASDRAMSEAPESTRASMAEQVAEAATAPDVAVPIDDVMEASAFEQRDADLTPLIVAGAKKLKRVLADEQNEVLDRLRRSDPVTSLDALIPDAVEHSRRYADAIHDDLLVAASAGAQIASPERTARLTKARGQHAVAHAAAMLDEWLIGPLRDRLERCVSEGDADNAAITKKVRSVYREWKTQHIDEHLDDVMRSAHGSGVLAGTEPLAPVRWTPDPRHGPCPDCDDNSLEGAVAAGEPFPTGHTFAPAHPGCRCMLLTAAP